ncbi:MAG: ABC transporter ATP-binding protein [Gordonia paraffinivorans]
MTTLEPPPAIRIEGVTKSFGDLRVLRGVDLTVPRGGILALLGANGAGKTTLIRILATLLSADDGTVAVDGLDVATQGRRVREILSLTGQFAAVDPILTGRENLALVARLRHVDDQRGVVEELLTRFSLQTAADRRVATYSGGMRRRLDIGMGLIGDPSVVVLDEPTTGLDPHARTEVWDTVAHLAAGGVTVLLTTQYLEEAERLADRIAILHDGRVLVEGTRDDLARLLPPARVEYVEKKPTLEEIFLALTAQEAR